MNCTCGKSGCILKTHSDYNRYSELQRVKFNTEQRGCVGCEKFTSYRETTASHERVNVDVEPRLHKCRLVKKMLCMAYVVKKGIKINNSMFAQHEKLVLAFDKEVIINLKLKEALSKDLRGTIEMKKEILHFRNSEKDKDREIRMLKKQNKQLKLAIVGDDSNIDSDTSDADTIEEIIDDVPIDTTINDADDRLQIIKDYQSIKNYMCDTNQSLSNICNNQNLFGRDRNELYISFVNTKLKRLNICHPEIYCPIESDFKFR